MTTPIQKLNQKIRNHRWRKNRHLKALRNDNLTDAQKRRHIEGVEIQEAIISKLRKLKEKEAKNMNLGE